MSSPVTLADLAKMDNADFIATVGGVYENSPWVAESVLNSAPFDSITSLHKAMKGAVDSAPEEKKLALINAHPDLAGKAALAGELTAESKEEQGKAGLDTLTQSELEHFTKMNDEYKAKFGFVFILAVRNATKHTILSSFEARLKNTRMKEFEECVTQIHKIAWMRLLTVLEPADTGFLTCHVLDTAGGTPADKMKIVLKRVSGGGKIGVIGEFVTNDDGRLTGGPALKGNKEVSGYSGNRRSRRSRNTNHNPNPIPNPQSPTPPPHPVHRGSIRMDVQRRRLLRQGGFLARGDPFPLERSASIWHRQPRGSLPCPTPMQSVWIQHLPGKLG
jgi:2-oxo-4-hydroxy-4-carboxy-5-ureidoimidazoline decarboxylase